ncbi:hypothetical protein OC844_007105 [Tilletia horrida]|nr:hypothetical protein OC844_007105 [Tilletia horrida]
MVSQSSSSSSSVSASQRNALCRAAMDARSLSYSPYSKFRVGAAILFANGEIVHGANIENASYGGTICAERTAIVKARTTPSLILDEAQSATAGAQGVEGQPKMQPILAIAVSTDLNEACSPCGFCRQVLREFCNVSMPIYMLTRSWSADAEGNFSESDKTCVTKTLEDLLPMSFGPDQLDLPRS